MCLIVDDDPNLGAVLESELTTRSYRVTVLHSPEEAIARIETGEDDIDVILTDFRMEGVSGADLSRESSVPALESRGRHDLVREHGHRDRGHSGRSLRLRDETVRARRFA